MKEGIRAFISQEELRRFTQVSDLRGALAVLGDWLVVLLAFAVVAYWPHPLLAIAALIVVGGRQLALVVLMHEAAHRTLFRNRRLNDFAGTWLCGAPLWSDVSRYRQHHLRHHSFTGTDRDPDLCLVTPFPSSRSSLLRKVFRDLSGLSGLRRVAGLIAVDFGLLTYSASGGSQPIEHPEPWIRRMKVGLRRMMPVLLTNGVLALSLAAAGQLWLYGLWIVAYLTTYSLFLRFRAIAEHAGTERSANPLRNTRTVARPGLLARWTVAPHDVCYHLEHHLAMSVPFYRLRSLHHRLVELGALSESPVENSYLRVWKSVVRPA